MAEAEAFLNTARLPTPRHLKDEESIESLTHWWTTFRNYYRRDKYVGGFLVSTFTWDPTKDFYGFEDETTGLKRPKADWAEDLSGFMEIVAGYMENSYLTDRLKTSTKNIADVKTCLFKLYDAELSQDSLLDVSKMRKSSTETPHQFFEKLSSHYTKHLTKPGVKVESFNSGDKGDQMNLSMMNFIAVQWLEKINPSLIGVIRVEFADDLRNKSLYEMMPRIATVIPQLLQKGELNAAINKLSVDDEKTGLDDTEGASADILRVDGNKFRKNKYNNNKFKRDDYNKFRKDDRDRKVTCMHCKLLNRELKADFNVFHDPDKCYRKKSAIRLLNYDEDDEIEDEYVSENEGDLHSKITMSNEHSSFQADTSPTQAGADPSVLNYLARNVLTGLQKSRGNLELPVSSFSDRLVDIGDLPSKIRRVRQSAQRLAVRKAPSPSVLAEVNNQPFTLVLDEGAELNVGNERIVRAAGHNIIPTLSSATAAGSNSLKIVGQTEDDFIVKVRSGSNAIPINLGRILVVRDLGCDLLCGEPGKSDNNIITIPRSKVILFCFKGQTYPVSYLSISKSKYSVCRVSAAKTIFPEDSFKLQVSERFSKDSHVAITPKRGTKCWYKPGVYNVKEGGFITLTNVTNEPVNVSKSTQIGELRDIIEQDIDTIQQSVRKVWEETPELEQFHNPIPPPKDDEDHLKDIKVDPDNILDKSIKKQIWDICHEYRDVITPRPGRYNGSFGNVDTRIDFRTSPPENAKVYSPNYSPQMRTELARKLDKLVQWGVLRTPEELGVTIQYVSPSMIIPKSEPGEYRLVTDFSSLNKHIRKYPGTSPTIQEAKESIAKARYVTLMDLSNYFYQGGLSRNDSRFLGVSHPFKGVLCYAVEPQGLKNSSEHAYERIQRIFGDLVQDQKMTSMADGLYVLAQTQEEMVENLKEVMHRIRLSGLTIKPSKLEITPKSTVLFGWRVDNNSWLPTSHTTSALAKAELPRTAKQLRGWLGAFKQFSNCVDSYSSLLSGLEKLHAGIQSKDLIPWTDETKKLFQDAKEATNNLEAVTTPRPTDRLHTYSDFSQEACAVGGRMILKRTEDGKEITKLVGYYSAQLDEAKVRWNPCEGESLGCRLVLEHFSSYIRQSIHTTIHHCDNRPTTQAWQRFRKGAYSTSSRISAFLTGLSTLPVEIEYTPGKDLHTSDYFSRHPVKCDESRCQICVFNKEWTDIGDNCAAVRSITVEEILSGQATIPYHQKKTWKEMQDNCPVHVKLRGLILTGALPEKRKTNGPNTKLKYLHNLYMKQELKMEEDGMILVKAKKTPGSTESDAWAYSVPHTLFPGLAQAIHIRLSHPSKSQLANIMGRYFYSPGYLRIIDEITDNCTHCQSLKILPKVLLRGESSEIKQFASRFSADILERCSQRVMVVREELTQMMLTELIPDQTAASLRSSLIRLISPLVSEQGAVVRTDGASAFARLASEAKDPRDILCRAGINIEVGRVTNKNKNAQAENAIKILEKEILRYDPALNQLSSNDLVLITRQTNLRPNKSGLSPRELLLTRAWTDNAQIKVDDEMVASNLKANRDKQNEHGYAHLAKKGHQDTEETDFGKGDLIFLRENPTKHKVRDMFTVVDIKDDLLIVKKTEGQFRSNSTAIRKQEAVKVNIPSNKMDKEDEFQDSEEDKIDDLPILDKAKDAPTTRTRPKRHAANISERKTRDMMSMLRRMCASEARYAWVYVPGSEDEQYDLVALPMSGMNDFNLDLLFAPSSDNDSSMELDEGEPAIVELPTLDRPQTPPAQPDRVLNAESSSAQTQSRVVLRRGQFKPRSNSSSSTNASSSKRNASSPKASDPPKMPKFSPRKSTRSKSEVDYHRVQHRYDDIIDD